MRDVVQHPRLRTWPTCSTCGRRAWSRCAPASPTPRLGGVSPSRSRQLPPPSGALSGGRLHVRDFALAHAASGEARRGPHSPPIAHWAERGRALPRSLPLSPSPSGRPFPPPTEILPPSPHPPLIFAVDRCPAPHSGFRRRASRRSARLFPRSAHRKEKKNATVIDRSCVPAPGRRGVSTFVHSWNRPRQPPWPRLLPPLDPWSVHTQRHVIGSPPSPPTGTGRPGGRQWSAKSLQ